jgi:predicted XRE-type DNA-binding protein
MMDVSEYVKQSGLTQANAARILSTTQPRLNDVLKGKIEKCTVDPLISIACCRK